MAEDVSEGVDESLIEAMMALTVRERLELNDRMILTALQLRDAVRVADESADGRAK